MEKKYLKNYFRNKSNRKNGPEIIVSPIIIGLRKTGLLFHSRTRFLI